MMNKFKKIPESIDELFEVKLEGTGIHWICKTGTLEDFDRFEELIRQYKPFKRWLGNNRFFIYDSGNSQLILTRCTGELNEKRLFNVDLTVASHSELNNLIFVNEYQQKTGINLNNPDKYIAQLISLPVIMNYGGFVEHGESYLNQIKEFSDSLSRIAREMKTNKQ